MAEEVRKARQKAKGFSEHRSAERTEGLADLGLMREAE